MEIKKISNGLSCIFVDNSASDVVSVQLWIKCGSVYEKEGEFGVSHFIEHLLFKGTRKHGVGEVAKVIESLGGDLNAFTAKEYTCFYITLPSIHFEEGLSTLKELVFFPSFDAQEIEAEREVILEEIRRYQDIPGSVVSDNYFELQFKGHPYAKPILGYEDIIKSIKREDIFNYYKQFYKASNSILVVCGNIRKNDALNISEKLLCELDSDKTPINKIKEAVPSNSAVAQNVEMDVKESIFEFGYPTPGLLHKDIPALDVLAIILGQGESSRLFKNLRLDKGIVTSISSYAYTPVYGGVFGIAFTLESEKNGFVKKLEKIFSEINTEINNISNGDFLESEIEKAKNILLSEKVYERETVEGYARKLGHLVSTTGSFDFDDIYFKALSKVTKQDVIKVLNKYVDANKVTLSSVVPKGHGHSSDEYLSILKNNMATKIGTKATRKEKSEHARPKIDSCCEFDKKFVVEKAKIIKHKSGAKIITRRLTSTPLVSLKIIVKGGVLIETPETNGICRLLARTVMFGAGDLTFEDIAGAVDSTASTLLAFGGRNSVGITLECIKPFLSEMLSITGKIMLDAKFEDTYFETEKKIIQDEIRSTQDNLSRYANILFSKTLYQDHPYSLEASGTVESVEKLLRDDVIALYKKIFTPKNMVVSVVGDFNEEDVLSWVDSLLVKLSDHRFAVPSIKELSEQTEPRSTKFTKDTKQAHIFLGYKTCDVVSKDMYPIRVLASVLSGQSGRLFMNLRDRQSLAYTVTPVEMFGPQPGYFAVYIATENSKVDKAIKEIKRELSELKSGEIDQDELARAKNFIMGKHAIAMQSYGEQASNMALDELFGLGYDSIFNYSNNVMSVSAQNILEVANKYFIDEKENLAIVSNK